MKKDADPIPLPQVQICRVVTSFPPPQVFGNQPFLSLKVTILVEKLECEGFSAVENTTGPIKSQTRYPLQQPWLSENHYSRGAFS
jgi:hypothetical protein